MAGHRFFLVQRLKLRPSAGLTTARGFDDIFSLDYMGSAEFEYGAANKALKAMRADEISLWPFTVLGRDLYLVGSRKTIEGAVDDLLEWATAPDHHRRRKERTYFPEQLMGTVDDYMADVVAWWSFDTPIAWTLDLAIADLLVSAFTAKKG